MGRPPGDPILLEEEDKVTFLNVMISELNSKFAQQLDTYPTTDRSHQKAADDLKEHNLIVILVASHSMRLIDHLESTNLMVVDSTAPGFHITENSIAELSADLAERMSDQDLANTVVVIQLLDNIMFECYFENCDKTLPKRGAMANSMWKVN
jgi:hypothetical protein